MQKRHLERRRYFYELATTSEAYYLDYVRKYKTIDATTRVLEVGCGEGGNLLPFAQLGAKVVGIDLSEMRIEQAEIFFSEANQSGEFYNMNFLEMADPQEELYDIVLVHDVIEHIEPQWKESFISKIKAFVKDDGVVFFRFPAWQMPFGGHQQICKSSRLAKIPFIHLLPTRAYRWLLEHSGESTPCIEELLSIKRSRMTVEKFEALCQKLEYQLLDRTLWLINPHYKVKFNIPAIKLGWLGSHIPYLRNFFSTSCFYILSPQKKLLK